MFLIVIFLQVLYLRQVSSIDGLKISPGMPVPHAKEIDRILSSRIYDNSTDEDSKLFGYLFGDIQNVTESEAYDLLDISVLDPETLKRIVTVARRKNEMIENLQNMTFEEKEIARNGWYHNQHYIVTSITFMQQSIYATRRRLQDTRPFRNRYRNDISYNIAILYGTLMEMRTKIDIIYSTMERMDYKNKFIWYLFLYQRILAANVDVTFIVERMFDLQEQWQKKFGTKEEHEYDYYSPSKPHNEFIPDLPPNDADSKDILPDDNNHGSEEYPNSEQVHSSEIPEPEDNLDPGHEAGSGPPELGPKPGLVDYEDSEDMRRVKNGRRNGKPGSLVPGPK